VDGARGRRVGCGVEGVAGEGGERLGVGSGAQRRSVSLGVTGEVAGGGRGGGVRWLLAEHREGREEGGALLGGELAAHAEGAGLGPAGVQVGGGGLLDGGVGGGGGGQAAAEAVELGGGGGRGGVQQSGLGGGCGDAGEGADLGEGDPALSEGGAHRGELPQPPGDAGLLPGGGGAHRAPPGEPGAGGGQAGALVPALAVEGSEQDEEPGGGGGEVPGERGELQLQGGRVEVSRVGQVRVGPVRVSRVEVGRLEVSRVEVGRGGPGRDGTAGGAGRDRFGPARVATVSGAVEHSDVHPTDARQRVRQPARAEGAPGRGARVRRRRSAG